MDDASFRVVTGTGQKVGVWPVSALDDPGFFERLQHEHGSFVATVISGEDEGAEIWP